MPASLVANLKMDAPPAVEFQFAGAVAHAAHLPAQLLIAALPFVVGRAAVSHGQLCATPKLLELGPGEGDLVSRKHATIEFVSGEFTVHDAGTVNGTWLNDKRLPSKAQPIPLHIGDTVAFGHVAIVYRLVLAPVCKRGQEAAQQGQEAAAVPASKRRRLQVGPQPSAPRPPIVALPLHERQYDFFINHCQSSGQDQCGKLALLLERAGAKVWYDMEAANLTAQGMEEGVANARNVLIFLSEGVMSRPFCNTEQRWGKQYGCNFVGVMETDKRHSPADVGKEKASAPEDLKHLLDDVEFEPCACGCSVCPATLSDGFGGAAGTSDGNIL